MEVKILGDLYLQIYTNVGHSVHVYSICESVLVYRFDISKTALLIYRCSMKSTYDYLQDKYGAVMTIEQLAQALSRKASGLRGVLQKPTEPWMFELNRVKRRIGRRIYFPTDAVAALLCGDFDGGSNGMESLSDRPEIGKVFAICRE